MAGLVLFIPQTLMTLLSVHKQGVIMTTTTRTSQTVSEALGSELVTDGGFAAVTATNSYTSDFSVGTDSFTATNGAVAGNIDTIGGENDWLRLTIDAAASYHRAERAMGFTANQTVRVRFKYFIPSTNSHVDGIRLSFNSADSIDGVVLDAATSVDYYITAGTTDLNFYMLDGGVYSPIEDAGADDVFYIKDIILDVITFTSWTAGTGWAPQATAGALTGKAVKVAGTASDLEQDVSAVATNVYRVVHTATRTAGSETAEVGGTDGAARSTAATFTDNIRAATTGNLKIGADASFAGTIDAVSCKQITRRAAPD